MKYPIFEHEYTFIFVQDFLKLMVYNFSILWILIKRPQASAAVSLFGDFGNELWRNYETRGSEMWGSECANSVGNKMWGSFCNFLVYEGVHLLFGTHFSFAACHKEIKFLQKIVTWGKLT